MAAGRKPCDFLNLHGDAATRRLLSEGGGASQEQVVHAARSRSVTRL